MSAGPEDPAGPPQAPSAEAALARIESSVTWRALQRTRAMVYGRIGRDSIAAKAIGLTLRTAARVVAPSPAPPAVAVPPPIAEIPRHEQPLVSLILPVHAQPDLTTALVRAIGATVTVPYELIVVDDTAEQPVKDVVAHVAGVTVVVNDENLGYTRSLNRGAQVARGRFLVLLNDDTLPQPGWLDAMLDCAMSADDIGVVVPMYLDADGVLKEAGSIVWRDGSADNFGRGDPDLERSRYGYRREVDYGSGACLLVRADLLAAIGGLDERFHPAYYEDVDLCFAAREAGSRVVYEPRARVFHIEGATAGTDVTRGAKRFQVVNQGLFAEKWARRLAEQPRRGGDQRFASRRGGGPHVLIADERVPSPDRDGGSSRMWRLMKGFQRLGCAVTLLPADGESAEPYATQLEAEGIEVLRRRSDGRAEIAALAPMLSLAVLSRPHVAPQYTHMLRRLAPSARIAYDAVDLHYLRELRRSIVEGVPARGPVDAIREIEMAMVRSCDMTIVVTDEERDELLRSEPEADVRVIPTIAEPADEVPGPGGRSGIVFVGNFLHTPNIDAAVRLVEAVMPSVWKELGDVQVRLVGQDPPPRVQALAGPRVEVCGWVDDLTPVFAGARLAASPLRYGAGLKLKNVDAMAHGLPTVTTGIGAEGMAAAGSHLLHADEPEDLARHVLALLRDDALWEKVSAEALAFVRAQYAPAVIERRLRALLPQETATRRETRHTQASERLRSPSAPG